MSEPYYVDESVTLHHGDCLDVLRELPDASVDAVVTDPPYGLEFMGKEWDAPWKAAGAVVVDPASVGGFQDGNGGNPFSRSRIRFGVGVGFQQWCEQWATECLRVLKPGGHLLAFGGTRTWHRLACAVEDAGFEVRDSIAWLYGSGFPKSLDVSKAIDKAAGATREVVGIRKQRANGPDSAVPMNASAAEHEPITAPATDDARTWQGWGTALKPAFEPIVVGRKPLTGTVAANVLAHGTGALNIDGCRVGWQSDADMAAGRPASKPAAHAGFEGRSFAMGDRSHNDPRDTQSPAGRWPANVALDDTQAAELDRQSGTSRSGDHPGGGGGGIWTASLDGVPVSPGYGDSGGASRFFPTFRYEAKAPTHERPRVRREGETGTTYQASAAERCTECGKQRVNVPGSFCVCPDPTFAASPTNEGHVAHPTVKPLDLMRWLVRLVTPPGGTVLEPFAGSGTTAEACVIEGFRCIAIEREADYLPLIVARLSKPIQPDMFGGVA